MTPDAPMLWTLHGGTLAAIVGMTLATYACRAGGYWLFRQIRPSPLLRAVLAYIPGTLFVSYVAPALVSGGAQQWVGAAATLALMMGTGSFAGAIFGGTAAAWLVYVLR
jgi:uncharacterized membrane protein